MVRQGPKFFRNWGHGAEEAAGAWGRDEIRNMRGTLQYAYAGTSDASTTGVFTHEMATNGPLGGGKYWATLTFDASRVVPTGVQNVPQHIWQPAVLYLGRPA